MWNGNVIVSNPNSYAYSIVFNETCDPHPFKALIDIDCILWCHLDWPIEEWYKIFKEKRSHPCFPLHCHACSFSRMLDVIFFDPITFESVKCWQGTSYCIYNIVYSQPFLGFGNNVINLMWTPSCQNFGPWLVPCLNPYFIWIPHMIFIIIARCCPLALSN